MWGGFWVFLGECFAAPLFKINTMPPFAAILLTAAACLFIAMAFFPDEE
jgi:hypothetical protein